MSAKNTLDNKRLRREAKKQRKQLPAFINLVEYAKLRARITTGEAVKLILAGVFLADSHTLGFHKEKKRVIFDPLVPADLRSRITIHRPE